MSTDLLSRANQLERLAKTAKDTAGDQQEIGRLKTAIGSLSRALAELETQLAVRRAMERVDSPRADGLGLDAPLGELRKFIETRGRPTPRRLHGATQKVYQQAKELEEQNQLWWDTWATGELSKIERHKVAALSLADRVSTEIRIRELVSAARKPPTPSMISIFAYNWKQVQADLDRVDLSLPVLEVLARFESPSGVRLADLSDDEIKTLRSETTLAEQFVVRRQS